MATHYSGTAKEIRALNTYIKLLRATQTFGDRVIGHNAVGDLSGSQFGTLEMLYHLGPLPQKEIGGKLLVSKSNVVAIIDDLEEQGLVKRQQDADDRRLKNVHLTPKGRECIELVLPKHVAAITEELSCLSATEQNELARLCKKLGLNEA